MTQDAFKLAKRFRLSLDSHGGVMASDADVLQRFLLDRNEEAFAQLVHRHGPLVWGLCRRTLNHDADAEDAFQATFLALFQHAGRIQKQGALTSWLYGAAWRITHKIKRTRHRAQQRELQLARPEEQTNDTTWDQTILEVMDAELARLPAHYREPLLLCYLQGQSHALAAQTLGWPIGTVAGRLSRARELLRSRLIRRGVAPAIAASLSVELAQAQLPTELIEKTLQTIHAGGTSALTLLAKGAVTTMLLTKWLMAGTIGLGLTLGVGWSYSAWQGKSEGKQETATENQPATAKRLAEPNDYQRIEGQWRCELRNEVTDTLLSVQDLTFRGKKYATSSYAVEKGAIGERNYESEALDYVLDPTQTPKRMELNLPKQFGAGLGGGAGLSLGGRAPLEVYADRTLCTYDLNGDVLTINYGVNVRYQVNEQGKLVRDPASLQATFPKPGDPNVRKQVYRRQASTNKAEWDEEQILKMLRKNEVAHALPLPETPIRKTIKKGDHVDLAATTKVPDENGNIRTFNILQDIEVLADNSTINKDGTRSEVSRVLLRVTQAQSLTLKFHQDNSRLDVQIHKGTPNGTDSTKTISDVERKLLDEQLKACEDVVNFRQQAYIAGRESVELLLDAIKKRTEVKLDIADTNPSAMQAALKEAVSAAREAEARANAKYKAGSATLLEISTAKVERLNYELRLLRLEKSTKR